ncbi:hypothetical protein ACA910_009620 [Epithemia clementina (nom. ined.)]
MEENLGEGSPSSMSELAQLDLGQTAGAAMKEGLLHCAGLVAENLTAEFGLQMVAEVLALFALDFVVPGIGILIGFAFNVGIVGRIRRMIFRRRPRRELHFCKIIFKNRYKCTFHFVIAECTESIDCFENE